MATFADMAILLMSFFVLLLAFSEMDVEKYKSVAGSMKRALGVKADSYEVTLPDGDPADIPQIRANEEDENGSERVKMEPVRVEMDSLDPADEGSSEAHAGLGEEGEEVSEETLRVVQTLRTQLDEEVHSGRVELEYRSDRVIVRIQERGVFGSGSARVDPGFIPVIHEVRQIFATVDARVVVAGHTDNVPIHNRRYASNWVLSAARAASVVHELVDGDTGLGSDRIVAQGYADSRPLESNATREGRARNRRVDIVLLMPAPKPKKAQNAVAAVPAWLNPTDGAPN